MQLNYLRPRQGRAERGHKTYWVYNIDVKSLLEFGYPILIKIPALLTYFNFSDFKVKMEKFLSLASVKKRKFNLKGCTDMLGVFQLKCKARGH